MTLFLVTQYTPNFALENMLVLAHKPKIKVYMQMQHSYIVSVTILSLSLTWVSQPSNMSTHSVSGVDHVDGVDQSPSRQSDEHTVGSVDQSPRCVHQYTPVTRTIDNIDYCTWLNEWNATIVKCVL